MNNHSKKALHIIKPVPTLFELQGQKKPAVIKRYPYHPAVHIGGFDSDTQFHSVHETSNWFDLFLPEGVTYIEVSVEAGTTEEETEHQVAWFERIVREGFRHNGKTWHMVFGDWDDDGIAVFVPADLGIRKLQDLGLKLWALKSSDKPKRRKYFRRNRAHHEWAVKGMLIDSKSMKYGQVVCVDIPTNTPTAENGHIWFDMLHVDLDSLATKYDVALADGIHLIDVGLCRSIGRAFNIKKLIEAEVGDAFKGTALNSIGLAKGFFHVVDSPVYQIITFGSKKLVTFDKFFLGSLGDVKGGDAATDIQSLFNFDQFEDDLAYNQAVLFFQQVMEAIHDEEKLRHLFLTHLAPVAELLSDEQEVRENWILIDALQKGIPILKNPGLFRRVVRHLFTHVMDASRGRIPLDGVAQRFNLMPDLNCFVGPEGHPDGSVDYRRSSIPEDAVVCMDLPVGPLTMHRQPNGHKKEMVTTTNIHDRRFRRFRGRNRILLGVMAYAYLKVMGGGDMDDAVVAYTALSWIQVMATGDYEVIELAKAEANAEEEFNKYRRQDAYPQLWSPVDFFDAVAKAKEVGLNLGVIVNAVLLDAQLSGKHKENMLTYLADLIGEHGAGHVAFYRTENKVPRSYTLGEVYDWLRNRKDYQLRAVASNLEAFIDYVKIGTGDASTLEPYIQLIHDVRKNSLVFPTSFMIQNRKKRVRVPAGRLAEKDFITAPSVLCDSLNKIAKEANQLEAALLEEQWHMVDSIPESLDLAFPRNRDNRDEAIQLREDWRLAFESFRGSMVEMKDRYAHVVKTVIKPFIEKWEGDEDILVPLSVELARLTYKGRKSEPAVNEDGTLRSYPDALLWTNAMGNYYIKALEQAELTGLYIPVEFDSWSRRFARGTVGVSIIAGGVYKTEDGTPLGVTKTHLDVEDGQYTMKDGMVIVKEPSDELRMDRTVINENYDNPVDFDEDLEDVFARG